MQHVFVLCLVLELVSPQLISCNLLWQRKTWMVMNCKYGLMKISRTVLFSINYSQNPNIIRQRLIILFKQTILFFYHIEVAKKMSLKINNFVIKI